MLRSGARSRLVVHLDNLEKFSETSLGGVRDTCSAVPRESRAGGPTSNCLIDFLRAPASAATAEAIQRANRRQSSTSAVNEVRRTCLYDFHVKKQGESSRERSSASAGIGPTIVPRNHASSDAHVHVSTRERTIGNSPSRAFSPYSINGCLFANV